MQSCRDAFDHSDFVIDSTFGILVSVFHVVRRRLRIDDGRTRTNWVYFFGIVLQPPLPLQEFLPLQPLSPDEHPPIDLQAFRPLHECFAEAEADEPSFIDLQLVIGAPATTAAMAAAVRRWSFF